MDVFNFEALSSKRFFFFLIEAYLEGSKSPFFNFPFNGISIAVVHVIIEMIV